MVKFNIPESLKAYFDNDFNNPEFRAINELVKKPDGTERLKLSWEEAKAYNKALLMTALVRADYCDFLFRLWDEVFGTKLDEKKYGESEFDANSHRPKDIWKEACVSQWFYRPGDTDHEGPCDEFVVWEDDGKVGLHIVRYEKNDRYSDINRYPKIEGWEQKTEEDEDDVKYDCMGTRDTVSINKFFENPDAVLTDLRKKAGAMIDALIADNSKE